MPPLRRPMSPFLAAALAAASGPGLTAGFASGSSSTPLGQPLEFVVPVRVEAGESITADCVSAEVMLGERRLPAPLVRTAVEVVSLDVVRVRVTTTQAVDEPVVNVGVSLGCPPRLARRFVVFAEPPATAAPPALAPVAPTPVSPTGEPAAPPVPPAAGASAPAAGVAPAVGVAGAPGAASAQRPAAGQRAVLRARAPGQTIEGAQAATPRPPRARPVAEARRPAASAPQSRLRMEATDPSPRAAEADAIAKAIEAVTQAANAARAAEAAASGAQARIATLERTVEQLRAEARTNQDQAAQVRQRLASSEEISRWMLPMAAALLVLGALAGWLGWRLAALQRERRADWRAPAAPSAATTRATEGHADSAHLAAPTTSFVTVPAVGSAPAGARWHRGTPAWPPPAAPVDPWVPSDLAPGDAAPAKPAAVLKTQPLSPPAAPLSPLSPLAADEGAPRDVTIEELIDLEQQAEFFVVLGQDEAAIDLLMEHLRSTGGGSPLPYLKLLEIYRRRGDREAYERTRQRFNHRFNAYAPEWGADLASGRSLDDYPGVVPRLQQVWPRPLDAMAELEALLFRKSRGELFDLPAYREVLLLYSLARDLLDRKAADTGNVDFLLPMSEATEFGATAPVPYLGLESDSPSVLREDTDKATKPLDFDITRAQGMGAARPSLFGDLDPPTNPGQPRRG